MAQVKFYLHKRGIIKTNLPIVLKYTFNKGSRLEYYTGLHANASWYIGKYYTKLSGKPIKDNAPNAEYLNNKIDEIKSDVQSIERKAAVNNIPLSVEYFRTELDKIYKPEKVEEVLVENKAITFMSYLDTYIERCKVAINGKTGHRLSDASQIKFTTIKNMLIEFNVDRGAEIDFPDFDIDLYNELVNFMIDTKDYSINTYGSVIKYIKTILFAATEQGYNTNLKFMKVFKGATEPSENIYNNIVKKDV